ncbi:MAG: hypothetical protein R2695_19875 [Acidimicrobiales bacterium]
MSIAGLDPAKTYGSHLHNGACATGGGGHYQDVEGGATVPPNELWLTSGTGGLTPNAVAWPRRRIGRLDGAGVEHLDQRAVGRRPRAGERGANRLRRPRMTTMARLRRAQWCLGLIGAVMLPVGLQAALAPRSFFDDFPIGRGWITAEGGVYDEHFVRDVGVLFLALVLVTLWAAWRGELVVPVALAWLVQGLGHAAYHVGHLDGLEGVDRVGLVASLVMIPVAAAAALAYARPRSRNRERRPRDPPGDRRTMVGARGGGDPDRGRGRRDRKPVGDADVAADVAGMGEGGDERRRLRDRPRHPRRYVQPAGVRRSGRGGRRGRLPLARAVAPRPAMAASSHRRRRERCRRRLDGDPPPGHRLPRARAPVARGGALRRPPGRVRRGHRQRRRSMRSGRRRRDPLGRRRWLVPLVLVVAFSPVVFVLVPVALVGAAWVPVRDALVPSGRVPFAVGLVVRSAWAAAALLGVVALVHDVQALD